MCTAIVSGVNSAPVGEATKHVFDLATLFVERLIVRDSSLSICPRWNAGLYFAPGQRVAKPVGVIPLVPQQSLCVWEGVQHGDADKKLDCFMSSGRGSDDTRTGGAR